MLGLVGFWRVNFLMMMPVATWAQGAEIQFLLFSLHRLACGVHVLSLLFCPPPPVILAIWVLVLPQCSTPGQGLGEDGLDGTKDRAYTLPLSPPPSLECLVGIG